MADRRSKEEVCKECDQIGLHAVRAKIKATDAGGGTIPFYYRVWLEEKEAERNQNCELQQREQDDRILAAAEKSAAAAEQAAIMAKESSRWAMWAAIIALISIIVSIVVQWRAH